MGAVNMKGQSEYIGFIILVILVIALLVPLYLLLNNYSVPSAVNYDYASIISKQVNGGALLIFFNSTSKNPYLEVLKGNANYTLTGVFYSNKGVLNNITNQVHAVKFTVAGPQFVGSLPKPLIYNFSLPRCAWNYTIILQITGFNTTVFVTVFPNATAFTS